MMTYVAAARQIYDLSFHVKSILEGSEVKNTKCFAAKKKTSKEESADALMDILDERPYNDATNDQRHIRV